MVAIVFLTRIFTLPGIGFDGRKWRWFHLQQNSITNIFLLQIIIQNNQIAVRYTLFHSLTTNNSTWINTFALFNSSISSFKIFNSSSYDLSLASLWFLSYHTDTHNSLFPTVAGYFTRAGYILLKTGVYTYY